MYHYNLLPKTAQADTKRWMVLKQVTIGVGLMNIFLTSTAIVLWNANHGLTAIIRSAEAQAQQTLQHRSLQGTTYDVDEINQKVQVVGSIQEQHINILKLMQSISALLPDGVITSQITANINTQDITITGMAATRSELQLLRDLLQNSSVFTITNFPFDALTKPSDIEFQIELGFEPSNFRYE